MRWAAHLPESGTMRVHARWTATADRDPEARYSIDAADGLHEIAVDQRSQGGQWVALGDYAFAPGQPVVVTLGGEAGTLSADAIWFEPTRGGRSAGSRDRRRCGNPDPTGGGPGLDRPGVVVADENQRRPACLGSAEWPGRAGVIDGGDLVLVDPAALLHSPLIEVGDATVLDLSSLATGYHVPAGQTIAGTGTISGSIVFGAGSTISPGGGRRESPIATVPEPAVSGLVALGIASLIRAACRMSRAWCV